MTGRARWLLAIALLGMLAGTIRNQHVLAGLSLATFVWVSLEWCWFQFLIARNLSRYRFERRVNGHAEPSGSIWQGRRTQIEIRLLGPALRSGSVQVRDVVPEILNLVEYKAEPATPRQREAAEISTLPVALQLILKPSALFARSEAEPPSSLARPNEFVFDAKSANRFSYVAAARSAGQAYLPGLRVTFRDNYGFFEVHRFLQLPHRFRVLPDYYQSGELRPTVKRHNSLPRHGIHRLLRAGLGSELLELREYADGDPPKSIAWKVSARRGQLMTRKYEAEVPVRVHLFVDGSMPARVGGYGLRLMDQMYFVAASVAKAAAAVGDPFCGTFVDERETRRLSWSTGDRGFLDLLKEMADFADRSPPRPERLHPALVAEALKICHERYPELLANTYHRMPFVFSSVTRQRLRLAGVVAEVLSLPVSEQVSIWHDDHRFAEHLQTFVQQAGASWMPPLVNRVDPADPAGIVALEGAIRHSILRARDNEVYVIFADLLSCSTHFARLAQVVKLAVAKHHRVAFVCPTSTFERPSKTERVLPSSTRVSDLLRASERTRIRETSSILKREVVGVGANVSFSGERQAIQMVLAEMDLARDGRRQLQRVAR